MTKGHAGSNSGIGSNGDRPEEGRISSEHDSVADSRMPPLAAIRRNASQRHSLIDEDVISNHGRLSDDHTHSVVNDHASSKQCAGVNLNSSSAPDDVRQQARSELRSV